MRFLCRQRIFMQSFFEIKFIKRLFHSYLELCKLDSHILHTNCSLSLPHNLTMAEERPIWKKMKWPNPKRCPFQFKCYNWSGKGATNINYKEFRFIFRCFEGLWLHYVRCRNELCFHFYVGIFFLSQHLHSQWIVRFCAAPLKPCGKLIMNVKSEYFADPFA